MSEAADASALLMRSIKAAGDDVLCSAVTVTGQLIVWCRNSIYYTGNAQEADSVWMAPRNREFLAAQILLESNEWFNFWLATSVPAAQCSPVERVAAAAPGSGPRAGCSLGLLCFMVGCCVLAIGCQVLAMDMWAWWMQG